MNSDEKKQQICEINLTWPKVGSPVTLSSPQTDEIQNTLKKYLIPRNNTSLEFGSEQSSKQELDMFLDLEHKAN